MNTGSQMNRIWFSSKSHSPNQVANMMDETRVFYLAPMFSIGLALGGEGGGGSNKNTKTIKWCTLHTGLLHSARTATLTPRERYQGTHARTHARSRSRSKIKAFTRESTLGILGWGPHLFHSLVSFFDSVCFCLACLSCQSRATHVPNHPSLALFFLYLKLRLHLQRFRISLSLLANATSQRDRYYY